MRYFTLDEAQRILPQLEQHLRSAVFHKAEYQKADDELERAVQHVRLSGGARVNPGRHLELRANRDSNIKALQEAMQAIENTGALVKDLDLGLLDFMTRYRERDVCLCWKLGESAIEFWHGAEEGFRGRKPIDPEFLANHTSQSGAGPDEPSN